MSAERDDADRLTAAVAAAHDKGEPLRLCGSGSKGLFAPLGEGIPLATTTHSGVVDYRPDELVVTARCGTHLEDLAATLREAGQMLPFEPPRFGNGGTFGGAIAAGLSGPGRPWLGSVRDAVLGVRIVNGLGEPLTFGGQVLKNVAGYDVSRLMVGAYGALGILLDVSVRVQPAPETVATLALECDAQRAVGIVREVLTKPLPITASCHVDGVLRLRLAGAAAAVARAAERLPLRLEAEDDTFFAMVRDHAHPFFTSGADETLWRLSLPRGAAFAAEGALIEWAGAQVWWRAPAAEVHAAAQALGGHAMPFGTGVAPPLDAATAKYWRRIKAAFDPKNILNPSVIPDED